MPESAIPFDYMASIERRNRTLRNVSRDPVDETLDAMRSQEAQQGVLRAAPPDQVARATRLSREAGESTAIVEGREDDVERSLQARRIGSLAERYPAIGKFAERNPRGIAAARDDHESLGLLGRAWDGLKTIRARIGETGSYVAGGMLNDLYGIGEQAQDVIGAPVALGLEALGVDVNRAMRNRERGRAQRRSYFEQGAQASRDANRGSNFITEGLLQGSEQAIPSLGAALTGGATSAASVFGLTVGAGSFETAREAGLDVPTAIRYGIEQGAVEAGTEKIPAGTLVDLIARKTPWAKAFVRELGQEMTGEQVATYLQDFSDWAVLPENRNKSLADFAQERPQAAAQTALAVAGGTATTTGAIGAAQRATDATRAVAGRVPRVRRTLYDDLGIKPTLDSDKIDAGYRDALKRYHPDNPQTGDRDAFEQVQRAHKILSSPLGKALHYLTGVGGSGQQRLDRISGLLTDARDARATAEVIDRMEKAVAESKLHKRDPEAFRSLMREHAEEAGARNVFIPAEAVKEYLQSDSYDPDANPFDDYSVSEADVSGGDVIMPIEDALTDLVGTPAWEAVKDHVRLTPGGMSRAEATEFEGKLEETVGKIADRMAEKSKGEEKAKTVRSAMVDEVAAQFGTSYTAPVARQIAEIAVQRAEARAARLGVDLTGDEFSGFEVRQVMPEGVREAVKADQLDLVINAMRGRGDVEIGQGPTLLEWIKARGGLNDTGGDLASMGLPPGMIREFNPDQGALSGLSGAGVYGLDTTFADALSAGYFPQLEGASRDTYDDALDGSALLLDAIGRELSGSPVYASVRRDWFREAGDDLRQMLEASGLDPDAMSDADVRAAVDRMGAERAGGRGFEQMAGENALTKPAAELERAKQMEVDGALPGVIFDETGWKRGDDGKWRFEISDDQAALREGIQQRIAQGEMRAGYPPLSAILKHRALYEAYPGAASIQVRGGSLEALAGAGTLGSFGYEKGKPTLTLNTDMFGERSDKEILSVVLHEIQHYIQAQEGFSTGASPDGMWLFANGLWPEVETELESLLAAKNLPDTFTNRARVEPTARANVYQRVAGEIEARNTQERMSMTPQERRDLPPDFTRDRPAEEAIIHFGNIDIPVVGEQSAPDTIDIDGVERSTRNSEGQPIAGTEEGVRAFWAWFGDSKVVDGQGRPLVVYHGTPDQRELAESGLFRTNDERGVAIGILTGDWAEKARDQAAYFFTPDKKAASTYTDSFRAYDRENAEPALVPVYLALQTPAELDFDGERWTGTDKAIASAKADGRDGVIINNVRDHYRSGKERKGDKPHSTMVAFKPEQIKSINNRGTFDPTDPRILFQEARGRIIFDQNRRIIELFQTRNLSTALHELSHMWLEELMFDASLPDAPSQVKADADKVRAWFAANGHPVGEDGQIPTEAHELWARSGERYFMEGKAPTPALTRLFETFRSWLVAIYRTVDRLKAPITPEIREVFDRLLATDEEIAQVAEQQNLAALFKDAAEIGMSEPEFAAYQALVEDARAGAHAKLLDKTMATIRRREQERYRDARANIKAEETERIDGSPIFKALALMKSQRISRDWLADRFGEDVFDLLPVRVPPLWSNTGSDPEVVAELSGYSSAHDMIEALIGAERAHRQAKEGGDQRSMRARAIDTATDAEFARRYGDPLNDGSIEREALAAVHSEMQGEVIAAEIRVLARKTGHRPTPYRIARDWARGKIRSGIIVDEASPAAIQRYARNAAKAGRAAEQAMLKQGVEEAFRQKQFQMINSALLAEAKEAGDEVEAAVKRLDKIARAKTRKSVDQDYLEQAQALLEAVDLRKRSQVGIERKGKWEAWAAARAAEGFDVVTPEGFEAQLGQTNWTRLSVETLLALDEQVKQIMHLGRLKQTLIDRAEEREWDEIFGEAEANADGIGRKPPEGSFTEPGWWDSIKARATSIDAALLKMEQVFDWLDQGKSDGVFNRIAFRPMAEAQAREQEMARDYFERIRDAMRAVPEKTVRSWADKITLDLIDPDTGLPAVMTRQKVVAMALNWGNAGNRQRLADGYGWNEAGVERALMENLTAEEWQFVQSVWDIIDTLWPAIEKMERAINGVAPDKVEAVEVVTPFGTLKGGYYPAIYDTTLDYTAEAQAGRKADLFEANYVRATTRASATKDRAEKVNRPILLDLGVINRHLGEVIHDVTHREAVMRAHKFLTNPRVMRSVDETLGPEIRKQFRPWLQHIANSWAAERAGNEGIGRFLTKARANVTVVGMGFRFTTMLTQIAGYANSVEVVGLGNLTKAIALSAPHPIKTFEFAMERSDELRNRLDTLDRDIRLAIRQMAGKDSKITAAKRFAFHGIGYMDRVVSVPTWLAGYNKAIEEGMSEQDAAYVGDKAVRLSQGAGGAKDLAAVATGAGRYGEAFKLLTMFYSYLSTVYNRQRNLGRDVRRAVPSDLPGLMARAWFLIVVPPLLAEILSGRGPDDDEDWAWWAFSKMLAQSLGAIPVARDVVEPVYSKLTGKFSFGYRLSPVSSLGESIERVAGDVGKVAQGKETKRATRDTLEAVGYATGLVPGQIAAATQFLVDVGMGDADPETIGDWYTGITKGRIED